MFQPLIVIIREIHTEKAEEMSHLLQSCHTYNLKHSAQASNFRFCC